MRPRGRTDTLFCRRKLDRIDFKFPEGVVTLFFLFLLFFFRCDFFLPSCIGCDCCGYWGGGEALLIGVHIALLRFRVWEPTFIFLLFAFFALVGRFVPLYVRFAWAGRPAFPAASFKGYFCMPSGVGYQVFVFYKIPRT